MLGIIIHQEEPSFSSWKLSKHIRFFSWKNIGESFFFFIWLCDLSIIVKTLLFDPIFIFGTIPDHLP